MSFTGKASSYHVGGDQAGAVGDHEDRLHALLAVLQRQTIIGIYTLAGGDEFVKNAVIAILLASLKPDGKCLTVRSGACFLYKAEYEKTLRWKYSTV